MLIHSFPIKIRENWQNIYSRKITKLGKTSNQSSPKFDQRSLQISVEICFMAKKCIAVIMIGRKKKIFQQKLANVHSDKKPPNCVSFSKVFYNTLKIQTKLQVCLSNNCLHEACKVQFVRLRSSVSICANLK